MPQFILVYTHPTEGEQRFELEPNRSYRIGSRPDNDVMIDQKDVSRHHAVLRVQDGSMHVTDLDSKNGTFINGKKAASATFNCGDMVHLSSARLVIVEVTDGLYSVAPEVLVVPDEESGVENREETQKYRSEATMEDVVSLLETTAVAVRRGALADPLAWAVDRLGFDGALVLYRDEDDNVAMVSSAGDLGQLARKSGVLARLATAHQMTRGGGTRVQQVTEVGEKMVVATVGQEHVLVVRYTGRPPVIGDLRSLIAAVDAVLAGGKAQAPEVARVALVSQPPETTEAGPAVVAESGDSLEVFDPEIHVGTELAEARTAFEDWMIRRVLEANGDNQTNAAKQLGLSRAGLLKKMKKLGIRTT